jgi:hypothetical protein
MAVTKREDTGTCKRKLWIALGGEFPLGGVKNLSIDILSNYEYFKVHYQQVMGIILKKAGNVRVT